MTALTLRWAVASDLDAIRDLMARSINTLQSGFLSAEQVIASHAVMGLDTQLIADGTYLLAEREGVLVGCGGWSWRATLYGGDHSASLRDPELLNPAHDPAKIRAMYTHPDYARQGIGRAILSGCEAAAQEAGFAAVELMATMSGKPLYMASGYLPVEENAATVGDVVVPLLRMQKRFA